MTRGWPLVAAALLLFLLSPASPAVACSCRGLSPQASVLRAHVVAEVTLLEVGDVDPRTAGSGLEQLVLRLRLERIFKAPPGFREGDEVLVHYICCNSDPPQRQSIGQRYIGYFDAWQEPWRLAAGYCSPRNSVWEALPYPLIEARRAWLERQR